MKMYSTPKHLIHVGSGGSFEKNQWDLQGKHTSTREPPPNTHTPSHKHMLAPTESESFIGQRWKDSFNVMVGDFTHISGLGMKCSEINSFLKTILVK